MIEILSPAGDRDCLVSAVRSGADAIYLGTEQFNARRNADNFSYTALGEAIAYCHVRGVKVYLALNTLVYESELDDAKACAIKAAGLGVDGIICADLGLARIIKKVLPKMPLHASTQMSVHTKEALYTLKELGFSRVVPAREMSKHELIDFCNLAKELEIEVEVFIHGALCMCMSGQCLMSAHLGGRSGNRGLCAGTCRLQFSVGGKNDYALSLKDMCHIEYIRELSKMGVTSFKIEGRMKPPEYVAAATASCRQMADKGFVEPELFSLLGKVFSRNGFTDGYYTGDKTDMFGVRTDKDLSITRMAESKLHELYRNERQSVGLRFDFVCKSGQPCQLTAYDGENTAEVLGAIPETAKTKEIDEDFIKTQLKKLGGTPYFLENLKSDIEGGLSLRASDINLMRREVISLIEEKRSELENPQICEFTEEIEPSSEKEQKILAQFRTAKLIPDNLSCVDAIIIPLEEVENYFGKLPVVAEIPRGMKKTTAIKEQLEKCKGKVDGVICHNLAALHLAKTSGLKIIGGSGLNCINPQSFEALKNLGANKVTLSFESKISDKKYFDLKNAYIYVYGKTPLMLTDNCPISSDVGCKNCQNKITDRKGITFPVYCRGGYAEIYNSRPLWLADRLGEYNGFYGVILNFVDETPSEITDIVNAYLKGSNYRPNEYTRGLYDKGVL